MKIYNSLLELIGRTPLVRLKGTPGGAEIVAKLESRNPGGSVKDRAALWMIQDAELRGSLGPGGTIVEPTSGNTGVGLAMVGAYLGYRVILTMPDTMSVERRAIMAAYGAEIVLTPGSLGMGGAVAEARRIAGETGALSPNQFGNPANVSAHYGGTAEEILAELVPDAFVAGVGTGGTITGVGRKLRERAPGTLVIGVEPEESQVLLGKPAAPHRIQGIGPGFVPEILDRSVIDRIIPVSSADAIAEARALARREGILAGISSGAAVFAARKVAAELGEGKTVLVVLPDTGERYLSTGIFFG